MILLFLGDWWSALNGHEQVFWSIAIVFSVLFVIQFIFSLIGVDFDGDVDTDFSSDMHTDGSYHLDTGFTILSVRSIIAFFTFFGWTGVLILNSGGNVWTALGFSSASGFAAMFLVGYMMYLFTKLDESGNVNMSEALYNTGEVYLSIPANKKGHGKIHIKVQGSLHEVDALTDGDTLPTGASIRVIEILEDNLLLVEAVKPLLAG